MNVEARESGTWNRAREVGSVGNGATWMLEKERVEDDHIEDRVEDKEMLLLAPVDIEMKIPVKAPIGIREV